MKTLIIPDIHLKPEMLDAAELRVKQHGADHVVFVGDYFDDWGCAFQSDLYRQTCDALLQFDARYPCTFLLGNHDVPYLTGRLEHYSSTLPDVGQYVRQTLQQLKVQLAYNCDGILVTHAGAVGVIPDFYFKPILEHQGSLQVLDSLNQQSDSILWLRPEMFLDDQSGYSVQIAGHTPNLKPEVFYSAQGTELWVNDTWSTTREHLPYGNQKFLLVNDGAVSVV